MIDIFQQIGIFLEIRSSQKIHKFLTISTYFTLEDLTFQVLLNFLPVLFEKVWIFKDSSNYEGGGGINFYEKCEKG